MLLAVIDVVVIVLRVVVAVVVILVLKLVSVLVITLVLVLVLCITLVDEDMVDVKENAPGHSFQPAATTEKSEAHIMF